ncbi:hypothetical protein Zmor_021141 [Zophobas morio]|uniref:Retrotransposon gag domain-containing protein n=1 Tax=Zophobas morio TaxID=2755281 RepID=A0AA38I8P9_9CUCU|nr:hypothetical protein Zmor_021141 [Zophobas morio]
MALTFDVFDPIYLSEDELDYELKIRDLISRDGVDSKAKLVSRAISRELEIVSTSDLTYKNEVWQINHTLEAITASIIDIDGDSAKADEKIRAVHSRLEHVMQRYSRLIVPDEEEEMEKNGRRLLYSTILELEADLLAKVPPSVGGEPGTAFGFSTPLTTSGPRANRDNNFPSVNSNSVPVYKWNLKFDGKGSLLQFLEQVNDLAQARKVSSEELFDSAYDLFTGPALTWYRSVKYTVSDWPSLVSLLKTVFLSDDNDEKIMDMIRSR